MISEDKKQERFLVWMFILTFAIGVVAGSTFVLANTKKDRMALEFPNCYRKGIVLCNEYKSKDVPSDVSLAYAECVSAARDVCVAQSGGMCR